MSLHDDPDWGRSRPSTAGLEVVLTTLSICALVWAMVESVNYGRELGRPLGFVGFMELWFREVLAIASVAVVTLVVLSARLWRLLRRIFGERHQPDKSRSGDT